MNLVCLYYLYQWCTVKQISDNEIYLLIKHIKSVLWRIGNRLSYTEDARCLKVKRPCDRQHYVGVTKQRQCNSSYTSHCASRAASCAADNTSESLPPSKFYEGHLLTRIYGNNIYTDDVLEKYLTNLKTDTAGLRRGSAAARLLRFWVRIPPGVWMSVCCECCVLSGRGLCDELITRPEESYRLWCVTVCDLETSWMRRPWPTGGAVAPKTNKILRERDIRCSRRE